MMRTKIFKSASLLGLVLVFIGLMSYPAMAEEWNQYLNGPQHRSYIDITGPQGTPELKWEYEITGNPGNPVIADDGTVYVSSVKDHYGDAGAAAKYTSDLHLYAFDKNGNLKLDKVLLQITCNNDVFHSPSSFKLAVGTNGELFAVCYDTNNDKGYVFSFDASGNKNWEKTYDNVSLSSEPVVGTDNKIYVTAGTNMIYAINGNNGTEYWHTDIGGGYLYGCTLSNDETVVFAGNEWGTVAAINAASGDIVWSIYNMHTNECPVVANDGSLLIANNYYNVLCMLDPATGAMLWPSELARGRGLGGEPAVNRDNQAIALEWLDNKVSCYNVTNGQRQWEASDLGTPYRSPIVDADSNVYFGTQSAKFCALTATGQLLWQKSINPTANDYRFMASDMIMDQSGLIYFAAGDNYYGKSYFVCYEGSGSVTPVERVKAPVFSLPAATYTAAQQLSISSATPGATIRYTTNGADPTSSSTVYSAPIAINTSMTVKACAFKNGMTASTITSAVYTVTVNQDPGSIVLPNHWTNGSVFDFANGKVFSLWEGNPDGYSDDLELVSTPADPLLRGTLLDMGSKSLDELTTPPATGYDDEISAVSGHAYWAKAGEKYYKFLITSFDLTPDQNGNASAMTFKYEEYGSSSSGDYQVFEKKTVTPAHTFKITFNIDVDPLSINSNIIYVKNALGYVVTTRINQMQNNVLTVIHVDDYDPGEYTLYIEKGLRSTTGKYLKNAIKMDFTVTP